MGLSNYLEKKLLDHTLGNGVFTPPTQWWASAHTADPTGTGGSESGMARVQIFDFTNSAGSAPTISNPAADVTYTNSTGSTVAVTHIGLWDAASGGNFLMYGPLSVSKNVVDTAELIIPAADFDCTMD
jgi:hypothetical protein